MYDLSEYVSQGFRNIDNVPTLIYFSVEMNRLPLTTE